MSDKWRFIDTGEGTPSMNMAVDEAMLESVSSGSRLPTLRFYTWKPEGLSLGYFQNAGEEIDEEACSKAGIGVVRRLTGGRAVLHDDELTYSIAVPESYTGIPRTINESYMYFSQGILEGLKSLGIPAQMLPLQRKENRHHQSAACFDSPSWYEITVGGKKVVGSAQTRKNGVILQHGSIIMNFDADKLVSLLKFKTETARSEAKKLLQNKAAGINMSSERKISIKELKQAILKGFEKSIGIEFLNEELTDIENAHARELEQIKYGLREWNYNRC